MRYSKFIRKGSFKTLEPIAASYRIMRATQSSMLYYLDKHLYRIAVMLLGVISINYILNNRFAKEIKRCKLDIENPYLVPYLHANRNEDDFLALYKIMLVSSAVDLILTKTLPSDIEGSVAYYARPYEVLANNVEVIQNWQKLVPLIFNSQTLCQVSDLLINYKPLTYYGPQTKIQPDKLLTNDILKKASGYYGRVTMNIPFSQVSNTEPVLMSKLLLSSELVGFRDTSSVTSEEQLQKKVEGIIVILENNINEAVQKRKLVIPAETIKTLTRIFAITMFQSLNESIEADIIDYETANIFNASLTNPLTYQFIDHRSDIMYDFSRNLMKKLGTMHYLLKIFSKVENSQLVKTIGEIISQELPRNNIERIISNVRLIGGERMSRFEGSLLTATMALNVDKALVPEQFRSRRYLMEVKTNLENLNKLKNEFNTQVVMRNLLNLFVTATVGTIACNMPHILLYVRSDHGKYLFLSVTHETWLGLALLLMFINFNIMFGTMCTSFYLANTPTILTYDLPNSKVIELFRPIIMPSTIDYVKRNYKKNLFVLLLCILLMFFTDEHQFYTISYIMSYLIYFVEYGSLILLSYVSLKDILPASMFSIPIISTASRRQLSGQVQVLNTTKTLPTYMCIFADNESAKYISIESWIATNNSFRYNLLQNSIFIVYFGIMLAFLKLKLWHLPGAPEEYISIT